MLNSSRRVRGEFDYIWRVLEEIKVYLSLNSTVRFCDIWKNPYFSNQLANLDDPRAQNYVF